MTAAIKNILSKLGAIGLLIAAIFAFAAGVAAPLYERWHNADDAIAQNRILLGRYLSVANAVAEPAAAGVTMGEYLEGETDALKLANLQARITAAAKERGVRLASTRAAEIPDLGQARRLGLHAQLSTELDQLQGLLHDIEAKERGLFVEMLHILRGPRSEGLTLPSLDVSLVVAGVAPEKTE